MAVCPKRKATVLAPSSYTYSIIHCHFECGTRAPPFWQNCGSPPLPSRPIIKFTKGHLQLVKAMCDWLISIWVRALNGPDAPRPYKRTLCASYSDISPRKPCSLLKFQMAPRINFKCPLGPRRRNPGMYFLFPLKIPSKRTSSTFPTGLLRRELPFYKVFLHISQIPHKNVPK